MPITPLPTPPLRSDGPATFADRGDAFLAALPAFATEANALGTQVSADAAAVAAAAPGAVAAANFKGEYAPGTTYQVGESASYGGDTWYAKTVNLGVTPVAGAAWQRVVAIPSQTGQTGKVLTTDGNVPSWADVFPAGTAMLFAQTAAPTGWTKSTTHNDKALRVVSGTAGSGGSASFTSTFASRTPTGAVTVGATTLSTAQIPSHAHSVTGSDSFNGGGSGDNFVRSNGGNTGSAGGGGSHTHTGSFTGSAMDFAVQYVDVIIATKD